MGATSGIGGGAAGPWYRVQAMTADGRRGATAERDYASVLPAVLNAARHRRPFVAGWLSRGGGGPARVIAQPARAPRGAAAPASGGGPAGRAGLSGRAGPSPSSRAGAPSPAGPSSRTGSSN